MNAQCKGQKLLATYDRIQLIHEIVRRFSAVSAFHKEKIGRDLVVPSSVQKQLDTAKAMWVRWTKESRKPRPLYTYSEAEYTDVSSLATWLVETFHKINGTDCPNVAIWGVCFEAHGVENLGQTGLLLN